jgi:hypothetical protein
LTDANDWVYKDRDAWARDAPHETQPIHTLVIDPGGPVAAFIEANH